LQPQTKWNFDPALLAGKEIDQLNVMIQERDPSVHPFDTVEEAIAFLSSEFQPQS